MTIRNLSYGSRYLDVHIGMKSVVTETGAHRLNINCTQDTESLYLKQIALIFYASLCRLTQF